MDSRVLIYAPHGRDSNVVQTVLNAHGMRCTVCPDPEGLLAELELDAAAAVVTEEVLAGGFDEAIGAYLQRQPAWSDFPFVVLAMRQAGRRSPRALASLQELGNLVLLERPLNPETLVSAARSALRARRRQYATRLHLQDLQAAKLSVEHLNVELESRIQARTAALADANDRLMREIAERERAQSGAVQSQKLEAIGRLTGGIAHDFNNLLQVVSVNLQFITRLAKDERLGTYAKRAKESVNRGSRLTGQLLSFARARSLLPKLHDVNALINNLRELIHVSVGSKIRVEIDLCAGRAWVKLDGSQLEMAILNLVVNSRDAMPNGGSLRIRTEVSHASADGAAELLCTIRDTGSGISEAMLPKVFDPFFTTKANGEGTGLGLSQVYGFARQSGGSVDVQSTLGQGTTVMLKFSLAQQDEADADSSAPEPPSWPVAPTAGPRSEVLVVEDDAGVRQGIAEGLRLLQYTVREACDGLSGLAELRRARPDLLMVDYLMPGMNGAELVAAARQLYPALPILLATGYANMAEVEEAVGAHSVLMKPFDLEALGQAVGSKLVNAKLEP